MELRDYLNVIRARKWIIIQAVVIVTLTAVVVSLVQPPVYEAAAKVLISESDSGISLFGSVLPELSSQPERSLQTQVELMQLRPLAEDTIRQLGLEITSEELLAQIEIDSVGLTNIVEVRARSGERERAAEIANAMAGAYVAWSRAANREALQSAADEVEERLSEAREEILALSRRVSDEGATEELSAELEIAANAYVTLAEKLEQLRIDSELESGSGRVVSAAIAPQSPIAPSPQRSGLLGVLGGLVLGVGMAFLYEYMDNTIKSPEEVERIYGAPVLGTIPAAKSDDGERRLTVTDATLSPTAEAYRALRNSLDFLNFEGDMNTIVVSSAAPGEGKSTVSANLAAALGQAGKRVVLVSSDFRRPTTEAFFGVNNLLGLSDVLLGTHTLKSALQRPGEDSVLVLTSGKMPPNPAELLSSSKMKALLDELKEWADWVIIDTPPLLAVADPASVARWADGVLLVSQAGRSTRDAARKAGELLSKVGATVVGVVVWGLREGKQGQGYGYYTSGYYYADYYAQPRSVSSAPEPRGVMDEAWWGPPESGGRRVARVLGRVLSGLLGFLVVLALAALTVYLLDGYFSWGLADSLFGALFG